MVNFPVTLGSVSAEFAFMEEVFEVLEFVDGFGEYGFLVLPEYIGPVGDCLGSIV